MVEFYLPLAMLDLSKRSKFENFEETKVVFT